MKSSRRVTVENFDSIRSSFASSLSKKQLTRSKFDLLLKIVLDAESQILQILPDSADVVKHEEKGFEVVKGSKHRRTREEIEAAKRLQSEAAS